MSNLFSTFYSEDNYYYYISTLNCANESQYKTSSKPNQTVSPCLKFVDVTSSNLALQNDSSKVFTVFSSYFRSIYLTTF